jgi:hypothetical protein
MHTKLQLVKCLGKQARGRITKWENSFTMGLTSTVYYYGRQINLVQHWTDFRVLVLAKLVTALYVFNLKLRRTVKKLIVLKNGKCYNKYGIIK